MTVTYFPKIQTGTTFGSSLRLLFIYKGGVPQHLLCSFVFYFLAHLALQLLYVCLLAHFPEAKYWFEYVCVICHWNHVDIPLTLVLGFYVTHIVQRWWAMFTSIPWPDRLCMKLACHAPGSDPAVVAARLEVARLASAASVVTLRNMSTEVTRRYPYPVAMEKAGLLTKDERLALEDLEAKNAASELKFSLYWVPIQWMQQHLDKMHREKMFTTDFGYASVVEEAQTYNTLNGGLICYSWINFPLGYVQVATAAVHVYFAALLFGSQKISPDPERWADLGWAEATDLRQCTVVPLFVMAQFFFYVGWFKVAETLLNPFGEDVNDFDMTYIIKRNREVAETICDAGSHGLIPGSAPTSTLPTLPEEDDKEEKLLVPWQQGEVGEAGADPEAAADSSASPEPTASWTTPLLAKHKVSAPQPTAQMMRESIEAAEAAASEAVGIFADPAKFIERLSSFRLPTRRPRPPQQPRGSRSRRATSWNQTRSSASVAARNKARVAAEAKRSVSFNLGYCGNGERRKEAAAADADREARLLRSLLVSRIEAAEEEDEAPRTHDQV